MFKGRQLLSLFYRSSPTSLLKGLATRKCSQTFSSYAETRQMLASVQSGKISLQKDEEQAIATITLDHYERKNALSGSMMVDLSDIVAELETWTTGKGLILHGSGNTFCSGGDLKLMREILDPISGSKMCHFMQNELNRLYRLPLVSVALLEGQVLGGGAELATACDFRIVTDAVSIGFVQARMGVTTGWGGGTRLVEQLGRTAALELLCSGKIMSWKEAIDRGFAQALIRQENSLDHAKTWLQERLKNDAQLTRAMKTIVVTATDNSHEVSLEKEKDVFATVWGGSKQLEAVNANVRHE